MSKLKFITACNEANHVCDKGQYNESTFWEKVKLNIHLLYCKACRKYSTNNTKLTQVISKSQVACLDKDCKEKMKATIETALKEQSA